MTWENKGKYLEISIEASFPDGSDGREPACNAGDQSSIPGWEDPLEKEMASQSSILAWRIPGTEILESDSP